MENHLNNRDKLGMTNTKVRRMEKVRAKITGIIIIASINIKSLLRMGKDCQMTVNCRHLSEIARDTIEKPSCTKGYTLCH